MLSFLYAFGDFSLFSGAVLRRFFSRKGGARSLLRQMHRTGVESLTVVNLCAFFIGLVLVIQSSSLLERFGAKAQVATIVSAAFVREIGPVFAAIMFAGRVGTGITAEIGSMLATEQIDAYRAFGLDPLARLAAPRVLATALMLPALTAVAIVVGISAGYLLALTELGMSGSVYIDKSLWALVPLDLVASMTKACVFGLLIGLVATYMGFRTQRATEAVGAATTRTMVVSVLAVLVADLILTKLFLAFGE